jgi:7,8-dihydroneopterin aldolase/epimerase/oxygenase
MNSDRILISAIDCVAAIGVTEEERTTRQRLSIDVEMFTDSARPARTDSLKDAIDYAKVAAAVAEVCRARDYHLIETLAERIAERVLSGFPLPQVRVLVRKISPVAEPRVNYVSVEIVRSR